MSELDDFIAKAKAAKVGSDSENIDGIRYSYDILPASFEPNVPYFVGYPSGYLFISEQVPENFRRAVLAHEVKCTDLRTRELKPHCIRALEHELKFVARRDKPEYLKMRLEMFEALLRYYKDASTAFLDEFVRSRDRIKELLSG